MDKELEVLNLISDGHYQSQRQLATKTGMSLGTVNLLLNKMIREGLIKLESIPAHRAIYMLTPQGIHEKIEKTLNYIKIHYSTIEKIKRGIREAIVSLETDGRRITLVLANKEIDIIMQGALKDINVDYAVGESHIQESSFLIVDCEETRRHFQGTGIKIINIMHFINLSEGPYES